VEDIHGMVQEYDVECHVVQADYETMKNVQAIPKKPFKMYMHSHDYGLNFHASDVKPDSRKKMESLYSLCLALTDPVSTYSVAIMGVVDTKIGECQEAMKATGLVNLENARSMHTLVWHKPDKFTAAHSWCFQEDVEFWVLGFKAEDGKHPGPMFPGKWPLRQKLDTKVLNIPNLRQRLTDPSTGEVVNQAENNAYCAYMVNHIVYVYIVLI
jgi:hypothetical protein